MPEENRVVGRPCGAIGHRLVGTRRRWIRGDEGRGPAGKTDLFQAVIGEIADPVAGGREKWRGERSAPELRTGRDGRPWNEPRFKVSDRSQIEAVDRPVDKGAAVRRDGDERALCRAQLLARRQGHLEARHGGRRGRRTPRPDHEGGRSRGQHGCGRDRCDAMPERPLAPGASPCRTDAGGSNAPSSASRMSPMSRTRRFGSFSKASSQVLDETGRQFG